MADLTKQEKELQEISTEDPGDPTKETKFLGFIPTGGERPTFPASQNKDISSIARSLGISSTAMDYSDADWKKIQDAAKTDLSNDENDAGPSDGKDKTLSEFADTLASQYAVAPLEAIGKEGAQLANENQQVTQDILPYITGSTPYNAGGQSTDAVQAAVDAYSKAYATGEAINSQAYTNMGIANEQFLSAAPEQAFLQLLSQPGSGYYKEISPQLMKSLPESLQYALSVIGDVNEGADEAPKGGWPKSITNQFGGATGAAAAALSTAYGSAPGTPTSPSSLATGNPNTPSS
jgi:hypothetical protein